MKRFRLAEKYDAWILCGIVGLFTIIYALLSIFRHLHFQSFGYDLGIADQTVWEYSRILPPITTIDHVPNTSELFVHLEFIYILLAPFYWLWANISTLLFLQVLFITASGIPIFLLARKHNISRLIAFILLISYLTFYGVQNALWFDVHSTVFGTSLLSWFIYFLDTRMFRLTILSFFLTILCKENYAAMTLLICLVYFIKRHEKRQLLFIALSASYLLFVFGIYFPHIVPGGYHFQSKQGLFGGISLFDFFNTADKRQVIFTTFAWTGFLSLLDPLFIILLLGNLASYFILGRDVTTAQGMFLQYRVELAPLLFLATIYGIQRVKKVPSKLLGMYFVICLLFFQYTLHLPISYLAKHWFWQTPASEATLNTIISALPGGVSLVAQNNIIPHVSERKNIFELYPSTKKFVKKSPCGKVTCDWFTWTGKPDFLLVDTSTDWDTRHLLTNNQNFISGLHNMELAGYIIITKREGTTTLYKIIRQP